MSKESTSDQKAPVFSDIVDRFHEFSDDAVNYSDSKAAANLALCHCGCGQATKGGIFLPGHDAKLRAAIEESVGGLLALDRFIETAREFVAGRLSAEEYQHRTKTIIGSRSQPLG